jgi:hypothetical protein
VLSPSSTAIGLTYTFRDSSTNEVQFRVERCQGATCTNFAQIGVRASTTTATINTNYSYLDRPTGGLVRGATYRYRTRACDSLGRCSGYSAIVAAIASL